MKKILLFGFMLAFLANILNAQTEWAPIGARWYYTMENLNPQIESYIKCESIGDSIILGEKCKIIQIKKPNEIGTPNSITDTVYMYSRYKKVYWFDENNLRFNLLYDFNANAGDEWVLEGFTGQSNNIVKVDSVNTTLINGTELKVLYVKVDDILLYMNGKIIENIGWERYLFPLVDFSLEGPLRCYEDSVIGYYNTGIATDCDYHTSIFEYNNEINRESVIFPNPAIQSVNIINNFNFDKFIVYEPTGKIAITGNFNGEVILNINIDQLINGVYYIVIFPKDSRENTIIYKLIKL